MDLKMSDSAKEEVSRKRGTGFDRILDGLKVLSKSKPQPHLNPIHLRREKLISNIENQMELIEKPKSIYLKKIKRVRDSETGRMKEVEVDKRVSRWFWEEHRKFYFQIKYGSAVVEIKKGKATIECKDKQDLIDTLFKLRESCENGELDNILQTIGSDISKRFR